MAEKSSHDVVPFGRIWEWLAIVSLITFLFFLILPTVQQPSSRGRSPCKNNLKQIGLALHYYHETYGSFPPAYSTDSSGAPTLSWRVLILPFIGEKMLYARFDLDKPWDAPENRRLLAEMPECFRCPEQAEKHPDSLWVTHYLAPVGPETAFPDDAATRFRELKDGSSNTILVVEDQQHFVPWTAPHDVSVDDCISHLKSHSKHDAHTGGQHNLIADGTVRFITSNISEETLRCLLTINDGKLVESF
jgi:hypothetical protein